MEKETLYCVKPHTYNMVWRTEGEPMEVYRRHSEVLIRLGRASRTPSNVIPFPVLPVKATETDREGQGEALPPTDDKSPTEDAEAVRKALRAEYKELFGKDAHGRTSVDTLRSEIERKKSE